MRMNLRAELRTRYPHVHTAINCLRRRSTVYGVRLERPPALVIRTAAGEEGYLVSHVFVDGSWGAAVEVRPAHRSEARSAT